jgi:hypothetical protein
MLRLSDADMGRLDSDEDIDAFALTRAELAELDHCGVSK